jgi:tRNA G10  N-methylase Trm11
MNQYLFLLGKAADLAEFELLTVLGRIELEMETVKVGQDLVRVESLRELDTSELIAVLGGTVKIIRIVKSVEVEGLTPLLVELLKETGFNRPTFTVNDFTGKLSVKETMRRVKQDYMGSARFVNLKDKRESAISKQKDYIEFTVSPSGEKVELGVVVAVQNIDEWARRDMGRPAIDPKSGMLPPKVARMMINCALPTKYSHKTRIYDPFCGSGTILTEGLFMGLSVVGSDVSQRAVSDSEVNLKFVEEKFHTKGTFKTIKLDATHAAIAEIGKIDAIVTEPYLGPLNFNEKKAKNIMKGLEKLYIGSLKKFAALLTAKSRLVIVMPQFQLQGGVKNMSKLIDTCEKVGYTRVAGPLQYNRPQATIQRQIFVLETI